MNHVGKGSAERPLDGYVEFLDSGQRAKGEFHCSECGYGVAICRELPRCPQCGGASWEQSTWSPFARAIERA